MDDRIVPLTAIVLIIAMVLGLIAITTVSENNTRVEILKIEKGCK